MDHHLIDRLPCALILLDAELHIRHGSPRAIALLPGLGLPGSLPALIESVVGAGAAADLLEACRRLLEQGVVAEGAWCIGGRQLAWEVAVLTTAPTSLAMTVHERERSQGPCAPALPAGDADRVSESELRFRALADALPMLVWMVDAAGTCEYVNRAWEAFTGRSSAEECMSGWEAGLHPDDAPRALASFSEAMAARRPLQVEYRLRRHDGVWRWMLDVGAPRVNPDGSFAGFIGACVDIDERRQAIDRARLAEERLRLALSAADMGIFRIDAVGGHDHRDANLNRLLGLEARDSTQPVADFLARVHPEDRDTVQADIAEGWRKGHYAGEVRIVRPDGEVRWLRSSGRVSPDADGRPAMTGVSIDVTERRRAEQDLASQAADLARSNAELEQFAYVASHDLQEPLRMIGSYLTLLRRRCSARLDEAALGYLGHAVDGAARMRQLIDDLLAFSRIGRSGAREEEVELDAVVDEVLRLLGSEVRASAARIERQPLPRVRAHRGQLIQLMQNLVSNALKYRGAEAPRISIDLRPGADEWTIAVRDNGIGLDQAYAERVFELFQRLHTSGEYPGTGIGLALCRKIVGLLGGRIWVESTPGQGATFSFTIPATRVVGIGTSAPR